MRIIGGEYRRRLLEFPSMQDLRPTPDRVRETLFNWLGQALYGKRCLDLFAGSGALGLEAASRGADEVVLVERDRRVFAALQTNVSKLGCSNVLLRCADGLEFAQQKNGGFDVVFLDPPFQANYLPQLLPLLAPQLNQRGLLYVESGSLFEPDAAWEIVKRGKAGIVHYQLMQPKNNHD